MGVYLRIREFPSVKSAAGAHLRVSLIEQCRDANGNGWRTRHLAGLGAVPLPFSLTDRLRFWAQLPYRLDCVPPDTRDEILAGIAARIPQPNDAERRIWERQVERRWKGKTAQTEAAQR